MLEMRQGDTVEVGRLVITGRKVLMRLKVVGNRLPSSEWCFWFFLDSDSRGADSGAKRTFNL